MRDEASVDDVRLSTAMANRVGAHVSATGADLWRLRHAVRSWLSNLGVEDDVVDDIVLACAEAGTNACEHAGLGADATFSFEAQVDRGGWLHVTVHDEGHWREPRRDAGRGRGLAIMRSVMDDVELCTGSNGTTVKMHKRLGAA